MKSKLSLRTPRHQPTLADEVDHMQVLPMGARHFVPKNDPRMRIMGVVQRGQETGTLVCSVDGSYMQINGDIQQAFDTSLGETALRSAGILSPGAEGSAPRVTIKRRRVAQIP